MAFFFPPPPYSPKPPASRLSPLQAATPILPLILIQKKITTAWIRLSAIPSPTTSDHTLPLVSKKSLYPLILALALYPGGIGHAGIFQLNLPPNRVGNASSFGYARLERSLGTIPLNDTREYPIHLVFDTDPNKRPSAFGPYWSIPLFSSTIANLNQYHLFWDAPDGERHFFEHQKTDDHQQRLGKQTFLHRGKEWKAILDSRGDYTVIAEKDPHWFYRYQKGRLSEFKLGGQSATYKIRYQARGFPVSIIDLSNHKTVFEIEYTGSVTPKKIRIGDRTVEIRMENADLTAPDGKTNYRNYRLKFLREWSIPGGSREQYTYQKADPHTRKVAKERNRFGKTLTERKVSLAVNRITITRSETPQSPDQFLTWEAKSGFILSDSGATYTVNNEKWDPSSKKFNRSATPEFVEIKKTSATNQEAIWSYNWKTGVELATNLATGELTRSTYIISSGPAHLKLRKREHLVEGKWQTLQRNAFDPLGRLIRSTKQGQLHSTIWTTLRGGHSQSETSINGTLTQRSKYAGDQLVERILYQPNGDIERFKYATTSQRKEVTHWRNDTLVWYKEKDLLGNPLYMRWASGKEQYWLNQNGKQQLLSLHQDGTRYLFERTPSAQGYQTIKSETVIQSILETLTQNRK